MQLVDGGRSYDPFFSVRMEEGRVQLPLAPPTFRPKRNRRSPGVAFQDYNMTPHPHLRDEAWGFAALPSPLQATGRPRPAHITPVSVVASLNSSRSRSS